MESTPKPMDGVEQQNESTGNEQPTKDGKHRFKPQLSCTLCRNRKLKCDRQLPCSNCSKRNLGASCTFVNNAPRAKSASVQKASSSTRDFQSQIQHLEDLVVSMMNRANKIDNRSSSSASFLTPESRNSSTQELLSESQLHSQPEPDSDLSASAETFGRININDNQSSYVGHSHWTAILDNIAGLKDSLDIRDTSPPSEAVPESTPRGPDLLIGALPKISRAEAIASLPARPVVEALIESYLSIPDLSNHVLHRPTFRKEVANFWADPSKTPTSWIALLYSILCPAVYFQHLQGSDLFQKFQSQGMLHNLDYLELFRMKTAQCLVLSNYTNPDHYTVPTMMNYFIIEHFRSPDVQFGNWMMIGMIIRAGLRLGLHRDPSHQSHISVWRGEMNRRIWDIMVFFDSQTSLQVGLPRMIHEGSYDTKLPSNLYDEDFDESTLVLPPPRPDDEITPIGYASWKHRLSGVLGRIVDQSNSAVVIPYHEVMALDSQLHTAKSRIPAALTISKAEELREGNHETIFRRFTIDLTFNKSRCVLHRKYLLPNKSTNTYPYPYSVKACVDASMRILDAQMVMYTETLPGGGLHAHRWQASSLLTHDFLLAAMLICLYVSNSLDVTNPATKPDSEIMINWTREDMLSLLEQSFAIWKDLEKTSKEAAQAARGLRIMLNRVKDAENAAGASRGNAPLSVSHGKGVAQASTSFHNPGYLGQTDANAAVPVGTYFPGNTPGQASNQSLDQSGFMDASPSNLQHQGSTPSQQGAFDWDLWDTHFQPINPILAETPPEIWDLFFEPPTTTSGLVDLNMDPGLPGSTSGSAGAGAGASASGNEFTYY